MDTHGFLVRSRLFVADCIDIGDSQDILLHTKLIRCDPLPIVLLFHLQVWMEVIRPVTVFRNQIISVIFETIAHLENWCGSCLAKQDGVFYVAEPVRRTYCERLRIMVDFICSHGAQTALQEKTRQATDKRDQCLR